MGGTNVPPKILKFILKTCKFLNLSSQNNFFAPLIKFSLYCDHSFILKDKKISLFSPFLSNQISKLDFFFLETWAHVISQASQACCLHLHLHVSINAHAIAKSFAALASRLCSRLMPHAYVRLSRVVLLSVSSWMSPRLTPSRCLQSLRTHCR
jgi:hypothetical protein